MGAVILGAIKYRRLAAEHAVPLAFTHRTGNTGLEIISVLINLAVAGMAVSLRGCGPWIALIMIANMTNTSTETLSNHSFENPLLELFCATADQDSSEAELWVMFGAIALQLLVLSGVSMANIRLSQAPRQAEAAAPGVELMEMGQAQRHVHGPAAQSRCRRNCDVLSIYAKLGANFGLALGSVPMGVYPAAITRAKLLSAPVRHRLPHGDAHEIMGVRGALHTFLGLVLSVTSLVQASDAEVEIKFLTAIFTLFAINAVLLPQNQLTQDELTLRVLQGLFPDVEGCTTEAFKAAFVSEFKSLAEGESLRPELTYHLRHCPGLASVDHAFYFMMDSIAEGAFASTFVLESAMVVLLATAVSLRFLSVSGAISALGGAFAGMLVNGRVMPPHSDELGTCPAPNPINVLLTVIVLVSATRATLLAEGIDPPKWLEVIIGFCAVGINVTGHLHRRRAMVQKRQVRSR